MPTRTAILGLVAVAVLGGATGCEKQSPYITMTAHGVTVKARATKYCRETECDTTKDNPVIVVRPGDTLGIDVPRSVAEEGWRIGTEGPFSHDHYRSIPITRDFQSGGPPLQVQIYRDEKHGAGQWTFSIKVK